MNARETRDLVRELHLRADTTAIKEFVKQVFGPRCIHLEVECYSESNDEGGSYEIVNSIRAYEDGHFQIHPNFAGLSQEDLHDNYYIKHQNEADIAGYLLRRIQEDDIMEIVIDFYEMFSCPKATAAYDLKD